MNEQHRTKGKTLQDLEWFADQLLIGGLSPGLKRSLDEALAKGESRQSLLRRCRKVAGSKSLTYLAIEAYLGADQQGRLPREEEL